MHLADPVLSRLSFVVLSCAPALMVPGAIASGQAERDAGTALRRQVVTGRAVMPDGSAASGAVILTSAGGECVTGADGRFVLEVELAADAEDLALTVVADAKGDGSFVAHAGIVPAAPIASVGRLVLAPSLGCASRWLPTFGAGAGADGHVSALAVFDDGDGPALYAGGGFTKGIVKWNGSGWSTLAGAPRDVVHAMAVFDDGSGPALFAGGSGLESNAIAKWDGSSWSNLGSGMPTGHQVFALEVFDDGDGPALYAAGPFTSAGGVAANNIAKWDGTNWSALGSGMNNTVFALEVFDDGNGPALYATGLFGSAGGVVVNRIAKWDGSSWSALGSGVNAGVNAYGKALAVFDDGGGPALYVGGNFTSAGGIAASGIARWDGSSWSALGSGTGGSERIIEALTVFDDGGGPALYAAGYFTTAGGLPANRIARWDGSSWSALGNGLNGPPQALMVYDDGSGPELFAGGGFTTAGNVAAPGIAKWDGASWSTLAGGLACPVGATTVFDDGTGPALYAGGLYDYRGRSSGIAKWDGSSWTPLGSPVSDGDVTALVVFDDGGGPALHAGGSYGVGGVSGHVIVRWDGSSWSAVGSGLHGGGFNGPHVHALVVHDDGSGPALYAGGEFGSSVRRWDGSSWSAVGTGFGGPPFSTPSVRALAVYDDGGGPMLVAGGDFTTAGGVSANGVARWDGSSWSALGAGVGGPLPVVHALAVFDDGNGPALYAGGSFTTAGGVAASRIARWDGSSWSTVGAGTGKPVNTLAVFDDGDGPALFAGGAFNNAGGVFARRIARWDGSTWSALGKGLDGDVATLMSWDDGNGPALYAGGEFIGSPSNDSYLAKWGCRPKTTVRQRKL